MDTVPSHGSEEVQIQYCSEKDFEETFMSYLQTI